MPAAIVLSGGGAKGDFEVGAVRYLYDSGVRPDILCGVSVGATNAAKLAEGEDPADPSRGLAGLEKIWASLQRNTELPAVGCRPASSCSPAARSCTAGSCHTTPPGWSR